MSLENPESQVNIYPVLPLRNIVMFPELCAPLNVGREKSVRSLEEGKRIGGKILLVTQKDESIDNPTSSDLYEIGCLGTIMQLLKLPDGTVKVLVEGGERVRISNFNGDATFYQATATIIEAPAFDEAEVESLARVVKAKFEEYAKINKKISQDVLTMVASLEDPKKLANVVAGQIGMKIAEKKELMEKQEILETIDLRECLEKIFTLMDGEIGVVQIEKRVRSRVKRQMEKTQREYYLNEQLKAIHKELGEGGEDGQDELSELEKKIAESKMAKEAKDKAKNELRKLRNMSPMSAESSVIRNYLDWLTSIPWSRRSKIIKDIRHAESVLNKDHFGLEKVKERILEYLAVQQRTGKVRGSILCLVGPPGVGKTSLGQSIAKATGRKFVRMSLGGVRDEAEIRGHRRTYIGAMPGKIVQGMKKAGTSNPLFLLDEIDKLGADWRGDPSSALLEVLDPEQNSTFNDHYLEVDYDLSDVLFICTANSLRMPQPLLDRMEIIRLTGYTEDEKVEIIQRHIMDKQLKQNGLKKGEFSLSEDALRDLIRFYTREAGVRSLDRELANLCRKAVKTILKTKKEKVAITQKNLEKFAGIKRFRYGEVEELDAVGMTTGLAWTEVGGELLNIEAVTLPGNGKISMTGKLGDVMKESIQIAGMLIKSKSAAFGIKPSLFNTKDIHIHVPEGATPKDGPSAGVAMVTSIISVLTGIAVKKDIAMTGEVTLRGRVLPIGGLKEKLLAALRGGIKTVLIPSENEKDLAEIPDNVKRGMQIIPVRLVEEVLHYALVEKLSPIEWSESEQLALDANMAEKVKKTVENDGQSVIHH